MKGNELIMDNHFMEKTGKNNKIFTSFNTVFANSQCLFMEYRDVIKCIDFVNLLMIKGSEDLGRIFDLTEIQSLEDDELFEWYVSRIDRDILRSLMLREDNELGNKLNRNLEAFDDFVDSFFQKNINEIEEITSLNSRMNFAEILNIALFKGVAKRYVIYNEFYSENIAKDIMNSYGSKVEFVYGDFMEVLNKHRIPAQSTFVFSDIEKTYLLESAGKLHGANLLLVDGMRYNYNGGEPIVDFKSLLENNTFSIDFFDNYTKSM